MAKEADPLADFPGPADEQVVALAGSAAGCAAAGAAADADRAMAKAAGIAQALSHLVLIAAVVPRARAERERLAR